MRLFHFYATSFCVFDHLVISVLLLCTLFYCFCLIIPSNNNDYVQQTVSIDNENQIANIHVYGGLCSSDTIFDYRHGYIATRLFSRRACFVLKMPRGFIPELEEIGRLAFEKQMMNKMMSPRKVWVKYTPSSFFGRIREWFVFGSAIESLCRDVPVYEVERVEEVYQAGQLSFLLQIDNMSVHSLAS
uniref:Gastrokine-2 n=1 Tax=Varanus komodoensis TaxID=61221 RepID=A0A8D2IQJ7_VARKO